MNNLFKKLKSQNPIYYKDGHIVDRSYFINKIKEVYQEPFKIKFIKKGKYGMPECWVYPIKNPRYQKRVLRHGQWFKLIDVNNKPIMESRSGVLVELDTLENKSYLKEYLESCL